eukprot:RCo040958
MTEATPAPQAEETAAQKTRAPGNVINISLQRSPVFYSNLAKRFIFGGEAEVTLTGLGNATAIVVGAAEILKRQEGLMIVKKIESSLSSRGMSRLSVTLSKGPKFDELYTGPPAAPVAAE